MTEQKLSQFEVLAEVEAKILGFMHRGEGIFDDLLLELHGIQRVLCPPYGAFCATQPPPRTWKDIPALPLDAFRHAAIRCFPEGALVTTFRTSGTTGEGYGEHHFYRLELYHAAALGGWRAAGLPLENVLCLVPSPEEAPFSSLSRMAGWLAPRENFFPGRWEALAAKIESPAAKQTPLVLLGTALAFLDFFEWLGDRSLTLAPGSLAVETGGYKGTRRQLPKAALYAQFQNRLGLPPEAVGNEYGMTELSSQFYTRGLNRPHEGAPWVRAVVIDPETGRECAEEETGLLRIFDLANTGSCCALQTRDLAIRRGNGFELLGRDPAALPRGCSRAADEMLGTSID